MVAVNLQRFPDDLHKEVKIQAVREGITLKELVIKALQLYLKQTKEKGGD